MGTGNRSKSRVCTVRPKLGFFFKIVKIQFFCCFFTQLVKKLNQQSLYEVIEYILPYVLNIKRPLSNIFSFCHCVVQTRSINIWYGREHGSASNCQFIYLLTLENKNTRARSRQDKGMGIRARSRQSQWRVKARSRQCQKNVKARLR